VHRRKKSKRGAWLQRLIADWDDVLCNIALLGYAVLSLRQPPPTQAQYLTEGIIRLLNLELAAVAIWLTIGIALNHFQSRYFANIAFSIGVGFLAILFALRLTPSALLLFGFAIKSIASARQLNRDRAAMKAIGEFTSVIQQDDAK